MQKIFLVVPAFLISITASSLQSVQGHPSSMKGMVINYFYDSALNNYAGRVYWDCYGKSYIDDDVNARYYPDRPRRYDRCN